MPTRSRSLTSWWSHGRPQFVWSVPGREERAEDAVLHVEHGDLLMDHDLQPVGRHRVEQVDKLVDVEVVRGRHPPAPRVLSSSTVSGLAALSEKSATNGIALLGAEVQPPGVADEDAVGPELAR